MLNIINIKKLFSSIFCPTIQSLTTAMFNKIQKPKVNQTNENVGEVDGYDLQLLVKCV